MSSQNEGWTTLSQRARPRTVAITLLKHAPVYALLFLPPALWAFIEGEVRFGVTLGALGLLGILAQIVVWPVALPSDLRRIEALVTVALIFLLAALLSVPAFMALGMEPVDALFEGMSGITTTGLSVAAAPDDWPFAVHFFRSWLQWVGGLVMATAVLALLLPAGLPLMRLGKAGINEGDRIASTRTKARQLLLAYVGLTLVVFVASVAVIPDWREAFVLSLSGVSTGGFAPRSDSLASYSLLGQSVVILGCFLGAVSLLTFVLVARWRLSEALALGSLRRVALATAVSCAVLAGVLLVQGERSGEVMVGEVLNLISGLTTAGYSTGAMPTEGAMLLLFVVVMVIGADNGSTGGGIKLSRISIGWSAMVHALRAPSMPDRAVVALRSKGKPLEEGALAGLVALGAIYVMALVLVWSHFLLHGYPAGPALFDTVSTLSTVGLSTTIGADLPPDLKLSLTFAMWLGRLEFIAVIVLLFPNTWIKRR